MKTILSALGPRRWLALAVCAVLGLLAYFLKFRLPGYGFSALVCLGIIAVILFYTFVPLVGLRFPRAAKIAHRVVTTVLVVGVLGAGITEAVILKASFGDPATHVDYLVVLGAKVRETGPSASLWDRIYGARNYMMAHPDVIAVVSGGQGADEPMTEARAMKDALVAMGIEEERIWLEEQATSTWENICFSLDLIQQRTGTRPQRIGVVSSEYHLFRAGLLTEKAGAEFVGIPAQTSRTSQKINHFMREIAGVWHYLILGGNYD